LKKLILTGIFLISFSLLHVLHAQNFRYTQYTTNEGLPSDNVYCAAQDNHGFMYFGTDFGLVRYDGFLYKHYSNKEGLINKPITDMVYAGGDSIIFASYPDALQSIHADGRIDTIISKTELLFSIQQIVKHNKSFFIYQRDFPNYGILQGNKLTKIKLDSLSDIPGIVINCIFSYSATQIAIATNKGILIVTDGNKITRLLPGEPTFRALLTGKKELLIAGDKKIYRIDTLDHITILPVQLPQGFNTLHMEEDNSGAVWFRGLDKGIFRLSGNILSDMNTKLRMENYAINEFYKDNNSNFWICTNGAGILYFSKNQAEVFSTREGLVNNKVQRLLAMPGQLFIGTQNGLSVKKKSLITSPSIPKKADALQYIHKLFVAAPGVTGICITNVLAFDKDTSKITSMIKEQIIGNNRFRFYNSLFAWPENDSIAWMHVSKGNPLIRVNILNNSRTFYDVSQFAIRKFFAMRFFEGSYLLGSDKGILQIKNNQMQLKDSINDERPGQVMDMMINTKNELWLATEIGLFKYHNNQFTKLPKAASYGGNYCTSLAEDDKGNIWTSTWDGIFRTNGTQRFYYNNSSGLSSRIVNCILYNKEENKLYAGTDNGLTVFSQSPDEISFTQTVFIQASLNDATKKTFSDGARLQPLQNDLGFYLTIPYYDGHEEIIFEYKLDNKEWVREKNPQLNFTNLSGGQHILRVRPCINNLNLTGTESVFNFHIKIPFYREWWFILAVILIVQFVAIALINSINKKRKEKQVKQQMRQQQQMLEHASLKQQAFTSLLNPHFIFNALNSVQHFINQQDRQNANRYLSDFASLIRKNFDASQQTFIPLDAELENLRLYLQLEKMRFGEKINYSITTAEDLDTDNWMLPAMILQPFLENAILHGVMPATNNGELHIHFAQNQQHELIITIADNGIGIEKSRQLKSGKSHTSRGMQLIKERLELLGKLTGHTITLTISDQYPGAENPGTIVTLCYSEEVYNNYIKLQQ
jgi:ligand-binding sensor domain-containing protein/two-component sensor histidine kinase